MVTGGVLVVLLVCVALEASASVFCPGPQGCDSGFVQTNVERDHQLFYWFFEGPSEQSPVILWMNGGPGASSALGGFAENVGPYRLVRNSTTGLVEAVEDENSWTNFAHVIVLDQPAGTGYAYSPDPLEWFDVHTPAAMAEVYVFLQKFFEDPKHVKYQKNDFFIIAESYGGHYGPELARVILEKNKEGPAIRINLIGLGLGNGWVDPISQYWGYAEMAWISHIIDKTLMDTLMRDYTLCRDLLEKESFAEAVVPCEGIPGAILAVNPHMSMYDIRLQCKGFEDHMCPDFPLLGEFLNYDTTRQKNHAGSHKWRDLETEMGVGSVIDSLKSFNDAVVTTLSSHVRVLAYNGDYDLAANWVGTNKWLHGMKWFGQAAFNATKERTWIIDGKTVGWVTEADGLSFVKVHDSGHMVPMYQPDVTRKMLTDWINNRPIGG